MVTKRPHSKSEGFNVSVGSPWPKGPYYPIHTKRVKTDLANNMALRLRGG
jgi:hypothetical protein